MVFSCGWTDLLSACADSRCGHHPSPDQASVVRRNLQIIERVCIGNRLYITYIEMISHRARIETSHTVTTGLTFSPL